MSIFMGSDKKKILQVKDFITKVLSRKPKPKSTVGQGMTMTKLCGMARQVTHCTSTNLHHFLNWWDWPKKTNFGWMYWMGYESDTWSFLDMCDVCIYAMPLQLEKTPTWHPHSHKLRTHLHHASPIILIIKSIFLRIVIPLLKIILKIRVSWKGKHVAD